MDRGLASDESARLKHEEDRLVFENLLNQEVRAKSIGGRAGALRSLKIRIKPQNPAILNDYVEPRFVREPLCLVLNVVFEFNR